VPPGAATKSERAFRTIGEVSARTGVPQHVLRYWETRFPALKPVTRAGGRRYYRPEDVALVERIDRLLRQEGYTIRGVQQLLAARLPDPVPAPDPLDTARRIRDLLAAALADDDHPESGDGPF
jgi:DNA-binding transcriptional MerR regulator